MGTASLEAKIFQQLTAMRETFLHEIFLDLHKAYGALDRDRCIYIMAGYGVGPRALHIIWAYWDRITLVGKDGGYYTPPFKGYRSVTQGDPLPSTIFNVAVDAVIRHWVVVVAPTKAGVEGLTVLVQNPAAYLYADAGLVAFHRTERLQRSFDVFTDLFDWFGLRKKSKKMVRMACQTCHTPGGM